jgi:hypothetical protein
MSNPTVAPGQRRVAFPYDPEVRTVNRFPILSLALAFTLTAGSGKSQGPVTAEQANADWLKILAVHKTVSNTPGSGGGGYRIDRKEQAENFMAMIAFTADELPKVSEFVADLKKRYGDDPKVLQAAILKAVDFDGRQKKGTLSREELNRKQPGEHYAQLVQLLPRFEKSLKESIEVSLKGLNEKIDFSPNYREDIRVKELLAVKTHLETLLRYSPDDKRVADAIAKCEKAVDANRAAVEKAVAARTFPKGLANFAGPGKADELVTEAVKYLRGSKRWTGNGETVVAAALTGDWFTAAKHPLTDKPVRYGLTVVVAVQRKGDDKIVWLYEVHMLTAEDSDPKKAGPFVAAGAVVSPNNPSMMLTTNVPGGVKVK